MGGMLSRQLPGGADKGIGTEPGAMSGPLLPPDVPAAAVRAQLDRILASEYFSHSERLSRFLRFAVEQVLLGQENKLKEYLIGVEVFDRQESFDPRIDSIVRVEARRLRSKLDLFYETDGRDDAIQIQFRKGRYVPSFRSREGLAGRRAAAAERSWQTIAVLPFESLSQEPSNERFSDGLTQEIMAHLTAIPGLRVAARTSSFQYRDRFPDVRGIGEELRVDALLTGSVRREGERARITVQLVRVEESYYLWSESFDCDPGDVFAAQEDVARKVHGAVRSRLGRVVEEPVEPEERSIGLSGVVLTALLKVVMGAAGPQGVRGVLEQLAEAGEAASGVSRAVLHTLDWNWRAAGEAFAEAIRLQPDDATVRASYGLYLTLRGRLEEGLEELRLSEELAPRSAAVAVATGQILYLQRDASRAEEHFRAALEWEPGMAIALCGLANALELQSSFPEALEAARQALEAAAGSGFARVALARAAVLAGQRQEGERHLEELLAGGSYASPVGLAAIQVALGETGGALDRLESASGLRCPELLWLARDPAFDAIRSEARFGELVERLVGAAG